MKGVKPFIRNFHKRSISSSILESRARLRITFLILLCSVFLNLFSTSALAQQYKQQNLVSDLEGLAPDHDIQLVNPWGIAYPPTGPFWISDNDAGVSTLYNGSGVKLTRVVAIPPPTGGSGAGFPTGVVFNGSPDFGITQEGVSGPALFIFATEDGTISGWNPNVNPGSAVLAVDNSMPGGVDGSVLGAVYKGLAIGNDGTGNFIYATNFRDGVVEKYDAGFNFAGSFTDPSITPDASSPGFAPFGIRNINGKLFVTFAMQNGERHDDVAGPGSGFIDVFDMKGNMIERFATGGALNSPWGLALAPDHFGKFSRNLLVGNFGDGHINGFILEDKSFHGPLLGDRGKPISIDGLWGLTFGNGGLAGKINELFFTAGLQEESHGLFGKIIAPGLGNQ